MSIQFIIKNLFINLTRVLDYIRREGLAKQVKSLQTLLKQDLVRELKNDILPFKTKFPSRIGQI